VGYFIFLLLLTLVRGKKLLTGAQNDLLVFTNGNVETYRIEISFLPPTLDFVASGGEWNFFTDILKIF
jgi:hypothetical protein